MRRSSPRQLRTALGSFARTHEPQTLLARVQSAWVEAVGPVIAAEAQPVAERAGAVTVACRSSAWASELELLAPELLDKLNEALGDPGESPLTKLRTRVGRLP
jgi:predicted nucleic acid-binding Zn ribbon protein